MVKFLNTPTANADVEEIMNSINSYVLYNKKDEMSLNDDNFIITNAMDKTYQNLINVNQSYNISTNRIIISDRARFSKIELIVKKVIRKLTRWYIDDIVNQQVEYNASVTRHLNESQYVIQYLYNQNKEIKKSMYNLEEKYQKAVDEKNKFSNFWDEFYVEFENKFRGDNETIKKRLSFYLPHFEGRKMVVDIGCGRGEFLQLLKNNNIPSIGVDSNLKMVELCKINNLNVIHKDGMEYLNEIPDSSVDGIFASQVVEHLSLDKLIEFIDLCFKKLKLGGCLALETINPLSLGVYSYSLYMDPTHIKPVHPATLRFILENRGFDVKPIQFLNHFGEEYKLRLTEEMDDITRYNINKINEAIYGAQDYALICENRKES